MPKQNFDNTTVQNTRKTKSIVFHIVMLLTFGPQFVESSPFPGMGSSELVSPSKAYKFSLRGFQLQQQETKWLLDGNERNDSEISMRFYDPKGEAILSVKTETLNSNMEIENYAKKWMKDYALYGFDILGTKGIILNNARGYVIDLLHIQKNKQLRQVVFLKDKTSVILTCNDNKNNFSKTLSACNSILKTFKWL